jgi:hypothetical protein
MDSTWIQLAETMIIALTAVTHSPIKHAVNR